VLLPVDLYLTLLDQLSERAFRGNFPNVTSGVTLHCCSGQVQVRCLAERTGEPRWVTEREQQLDTELARVKQQALAQMDHPRYGSRMTLMSTPTYGDREWWAGQFVQGNSRHMPMSASVCPCKQCVSLRGGA
jgi:hypothetical protein